MPTFIGETTDLGKLVIYLIGFLLVALVVLGLWYETTQAAYAGLNLIQDLLGLPEAILNGLSLVVSDFFKWLGGLFAIRAAPALVAVAV